RTAAQGRQTSGGSGTIDRRVAPVGDAMAARVSNQRISRDCAGRAAWSAAPLERCAAEGIGAVLEARCIGGRVRHGHLDHTAHSRTDRREVRRAYAEWFGVASTTRADGLECAAALRAGAPARRAGDYHLEKEEVAGAKKIAARQGRLIVFIDESGLSERPCRASTWAPKGQTPILQYSFSWKQLSAIAGVS